MRSLATGTADAGRGKGLPQSEGRRTEIMSSFFFKAPIAVSVAGGDSAIV